MSAHFEELRRLIAEADELPNGPAKTAVVAEAVRVADAMQDAELGFLTRKQLMSAALGGGDPDQMAAAFAWCVAASDRNPDAIPPEKLLWEYRWVISELAHFPQVPRAQIEATMAEMTDRYRAAGSTLRPVHLLRTYTYVRMGDLKAAEAAYLKFSATGRDWLSDSERQELNLSVHFLVAAGRGDAAIVRSKGVLAGRVDEPGFFGEDSAELLGPLLDRDRVDDAVRVQRAGYKYLARKHGYLWHYSLHIAFLARIDEFTAAARVVTDHLPIALDSKQFADRTHFLRSVLLLVGRLRRQGNGRCRLRLPKGLPVASDADGCDLAALEQWLRHEVADYSAQFDARNGTTYFADKLAAVAELAARPAP